MSHTRSTRGLDQWLKFIDEIRRDILGATQAVGSLDQYGQEMAAKFPELRAYAQKGKSYGEIGQAHLEEQLRIYFTYTADRALWQELVTKSERFSQLDPDPIFGPAFSPWGYMHDELTDNIGDGFGWTQGSSPRNLAGMSFPERLRLIHNAYEALDTKTLTDFAESLGLEMDGAPKKSGGCYVATAVYGSYDAPEVWVLRRWRDARLESTRVGRGLVRLYYATSPHLVRAVGHRRWFVSLSRRALNRLVRALKQAGFSDGPYEGK